MKVRAKELGYYHHRRRREGEVFNLFKKEDFSQKWMELLEDSSLEEDKPKKKKVSKKKKVNEVEVSSDSEVI